METNFRKTREEEEQESVERFVVYVQKLREEIKADPQVGVRLMQRAGIWDENGQPLEKFRDPEPGA